VGWLIKDEVRHCIQSMATRGSVPDEAFSLILDGARLGISGPICMQEAL